MGIKIPENSELHLLNVCIQQLHFVMVAHLVTITKHLIINIFREDLFWFKASQSTLLGSHCDSRNVRQLITMHQLSRSKEKQMLPFSSLCPVCSVKNLSPLDGTAQTQNWSSHLGQRSLKCPHRQSLPELCLLAEHKPR